MPVEQRVIFKVMSIAYLLKETKKKKRRLETYEETAFLAAAHRRLLYQSTLYQVPM